MYAFFRTTCSIEATRLPQFDHAFSQAGMVDVEAATFYGGMVRARLLRAPDQYVSEPLDVSQGDTVTRRFEAREQVLEAILAEAQAAEEVRALLGPTFKPEPKESRDD